MKVRGKAIIISTGQRATFGLTRALSRLREREVMIFSSFMGGQAAMTIVQKIALKSLPASLTKGSPSVYEKGGVKPPPFSKGEAGGFL
jgi:hypothetical protein